MVVVPAIYIYIYIYIFLCEDLIRCYKCKLGLPSYYNTEGCNEKGGISELDLKLDLLNWT